MNSASIYGSIDGKLRDFEEQNDISLPEEYKTFLRANPDYFCPERNAFDFSNGGDSSLVDIFYGFSKKYHASLPQKLKMFKDRIPNGLIPIASDPGGNQILIEAYQGSPGKVFFWDHELEADHENGELPDDVGNIFHLADSFTAFFNALYD